MNLSQYVGNLLFLENFDDDISSFFDEIIFLWIDKKLDIWVINIPVRIFSWDSSADMLSSAKRPLYIIDEYSLVNVPDVIWEQDAVIVNLYSGISSFAYKYSPEIEDINFVLGKKVPVCEVYDLLSFLWFLRLWWSRYIRLSAIELSSKLFLDEEDKWTEYSLLSMDKFGIGGWDATILCWATILSSMIQTISILQEQKIFVDVFSILNYNFDFRDDLRNSLERSKKLIIIIDQMISDPFEKIFKDKFINIDDLEMFFISPEYSEVSSYVQEFRPDQAKFDQISLMGKIKLKVEC